MEEKKLTGYPSIDKPWISHYVTPPKYIGDIRNTTLYEAYTHANQDNLDALAIVSMDGGFRYTHRDLYQMIDLAAGGFSKLGITEGAKVGIMLNNTVEETISLLALNKIGAISVFIDVTKSVIDIKSCISKHRLQLLVIDEVLLPLEPLVNTQDSPIVIANQTKPHEKGISFLDLYRLGKENLVKGVSFWKDRPSVIINSSGTTGLPKPIVHSDFSLNMAAYKILCADYPLTRNNVTMKIIPSSIGLGLITTLYTALLSGTKIVLIGGNNPYQSILNSVTFASSFPMFRDGVGLLPDAKLLMFTAPMYFRVLCEKLDIFEDLSYMGAMLAAGSKMGKHELDMMNQKLEALNCPVKICNGYGQNELCGAVTLNTNAANKNGSAGFPVIDTEIRIVNLDTLETVGRGQSGLILERSDSLFLNYDNLPEETQNAWVTCPDGTTWFNTKDIGSMDSYGFLYITGRVSRVLVRLDFKIPIDQIEEKIKAHPAVLDCAVIAVRKTEIEEVPIAYIVLKDTNDNIETVLEEIQVSETPLSEMEYPEHIIRLDALPYMKNGKIDYRTLEREAQKEMEE